MAIQDRGYTAGRFALDIDGYNVGYVKKFSGMHMEGDVVINDLGPDNVQTKNRIFDYQFQMPTTMRGPKWLNAGLSMAITKSRTSITAESYSSIRI